MCIDCGKTFGGLTYKCGQCKKLQPMKLKTTITEVIMANKMIKTMLEHNCTPDDMIRIIKLSRERFNELKK